MPETSPSRMPSRRSHECPHWLTSQQARTRRQARSGRPKSEVDCGMAYEVNFANVSTIGLESSPVAAALAGLRANEARYFKKKYGQAFIVEPARKAKKLIDYVHRILKQERDIVIESRPLEATELHVENIRWTFVFYESGLEARRRPQALRRHGSPARARVALQVCEAEVE